MNKLYLNQLLQISNDNINKVKVRFNQSNSSENPMELYKQNPDIVNNRWLFWRTKTRYFNVGQIAICLLKLSATGNNGMLLQRWTQYVKTGHGGNKELVDLVNDKGFDYIKKYFQYSILENYNSKVDDNLILARESWWKETLQSRKFGYNAN